MRRQDARRRQSTPPTTGSIDTAIKTSLPKTCALLETAHTAFIAASASGNIKAKTIAKEAAAYNGVRVICADPGSVTGANALVVAATTRTFAPPRRTKVRGVADQRNDPVRGERGLRSEW